MKIKGIKDIHTGGLKCLIYGSAGVGKTTLAATLDPSKTLVVSFESGLLSLTDETDEIQYVEVKTLNELKEVYSELLEPDMQERFDNIFIDSLTEISELVLATVKSDPAIYKGMQDNMKLYMVTQEEMVKIAKAFRDLQGYNIFMTALADTKLMNMKEVSLPAMVGQKLGTKLLSLFDFIFYMNVEDEGKRVLYTQPTQTSEGKSRSRKLLIKEEANLNVILEKVKGK
jgi:phage nucleotide-binding protein